MLKHVDMEAAIRRLAERKIEAAIDEGKFDNLEGAGKPIDLEPMPADENARMMWWALRLFRRNEVIPDEIRYRKQIEALRISLCMAGSEEQLLTCVRTVNELIRKLNTMGTNVISTHLSPLDEAEELSRWQVTASSRR